MPETHSEPQKPQAEVKKETKFSAIKNGLKEKINSLRGKNNSGKSREVLEELSEKPNTQENSPTPTTPESEGTDKEPLVKTLKPGEILYHGTRLDFNDLPVDKDDAPDGITHTYGAFYSRDPEIANIYTEINRDDVHGVNGEGGRVFRVTPKKELKIFNLAGNMTPEVEAKIFESINTLEPTGTALQQYKRIINNSPANKRNGYTYLEALGRTGKVYLPEDYERYNQFATDAMRMSGFDGIDAEGRFDQQRSIDDQPIADGIQIFDENDIKTSWE